MSRNRMAKRDGFSLLELLVAMTILAIALVPVAYFYTKSLQVVENAAIRTRAIMLAQERLTEVRQMPYDTIRTNITPSPEQVFLLTDEGTPYDIDVTADDWFGYDFEANGDWMAMFSYPLPLDFNPYDPTTHGYNNATGVDHNLPGNPWSDPQVNYNFGTGNGNYDYEYEPIGFFTQRVFRRNSLLVGTDSDGLYLDDADDIRRVDRRTISAVEPSLLNGYDHFRTGAPGRVDDYDIYGRRTIIMDVIPMPAETDGDIEPADSEFDGGATALDPYPIGKGPDNKFQIVSKYGSRGKLVIVQVFWLPRGAREEYIPWADLNKVELKTFVAADNQNSRQPADGAGLTRNDFLNIGVPY